MLAIGTLLQNRYRILRLIKEGGMGAVYLAEHTQLGINVALKEILKESLSASNEAMLREQFHREARLLSRLHHTSLARVIDHFTEDSGQFLVMDYIIGNDLKDLLKENDGPFQVNTVLDWADQLLDVLAYLHAQDDPVVHRDIKPENIKLTPQGRVILLDFGLAKGATSSMLMSLPAATMAYAPIEQVLGRGTDARSDLYSLGVTLYHLFTNTIPPLALKRQEALWRGLRDPLQSASEVNAQVPEAIAKVLNKAMALAADDRSQTAAGMRELLNEATRLSIAGLGKPEVVSKAQELNRDSYENTLPFPGGERSKERNPTIDDLSDNDAIYARGESELAPEKAPVKPATESFIETLSGVAIEMVGIPAGKFLMGSPYGEAGRQSAEVPQHEVTVASFHMGKYEVTQAQWCAIATKLRKVKIDLNPAPSHFKGDNLPVETVGWEDVVEFCDRLSHATGKTYRLPTEAEWEYACRAMTTGPHAGKLDYIGWYDRNSQNQTHPVGTRQPNGFGLCDMHGNVFEWCMDLWNENYDGAPTDGTTWTGGDMERRVLRGGCWSSNATAARSAYRFNFPTFLRLNYIGFRVVATAQTS